MTTTSKIVCEIYEDGAKEWYRDNQLHREDGPAIELADGTKAWYYEDELHRADGPAIEYPDGNKRWYYNGKEYSLSQWITLSPLPKDSITELVLYYG